MKIDGDYVTFESTGKREYCNGSLFAPNGPNDVLYGFDGGISDLTSAERVEIARFMISRWQAWLIRENEAATDSRVEADEVRFDECPDAMQRDLLAEFGSKEGIATSGTKFFRYRDTNDFAAVRPAYDG